MYYKIISICIFLHLLQQFNRILVFSRTLHSSNVEQFSDDTWLHIFSYLEILFKDIVLNVFSLVYNHLENVYF